MTLTPRAELALSAFLIAALTIGYAGPSAREALAKAESAAAPYRLEVTWMARDTTVMPPRDSIVVRGWTPTGRRYTGSVAATQRDSATADSSARILITEWKPSGSVKLRDLLYLPRHVRRLPLLPCYGAADGAPRRTAIRLTLGTVYETERLAVYCAVHGDTVRVPG